MICLKALKSQIYFNFENIIYYTLYVIRTNKIVAFDCQNTESKCSLFSPIRFPFQCAFHERCTHINASKISMNRKFNSFVSNWFDSWRNYFCKNSHIKFLTDCWMCLLLYWETIQIIKENQIISTKRYRTFGFIQMNKLLE